MPASRMLCLWTVFFGIFGLGMLFVVPFAGSFFLAVPFIGFLVSCMLEKRDEKIVFMHARRAVESGKKLLHKDELGVDPRASARIIEAYKKTGLLPEDLEIFE